MDRQLLLLGLLRNQEMHGYQINEFIDQQMAFCVELKRSTAYYLLDKLCREGYVSEEVERAGNRPERRVYRITPAGEAYFQRLLRQNLAAYTPPIYAEDIGVIFQHHLPPAEIAHLLRERRDAIVAHRARLEILHATLPADHLAVIDHHLVHVDAELTWLDRLLAANEPGPPGDAL
ncbi:MAG: PadR family transcriptional regulator [Chloroflexales bacterium]|nr:PadR family transcriptional regulator [Chloroflexales bacterium]